MVRNHTFACHDEPPDIFRIAPQGRSCLWIPFGISLKSVQKAYAIGGQGDLQVRPFVLDPVERLLSCNGSPVSLTPKALDTLICLVRNQGWMVTKDELLKQVWPDTFVEEINLAVDISTIRKALGRSAPEIDSATLRLFPRHL